MSSARIPLLSRDLLSLSLLIAVRHSSVVISGILVISLVLLLCTSVLLSFSFSILVQSLLFFAVEYFCRILQRHRRRDDFTFLILYLGDEHPLLCRLDSWDVLYLVEVFAYSLDVLLSFHSFFVSDTFFYAFAHFFQALFLFFGCASSILDESPDFNVFL